MEEKEQAMRMTMTMADEHGEDDDADVDADVIVMMSTMIKTTVTGICMTVVMMTRLLVPVLIICDDLKSLRFVVL